MGIKLRDSGLLSGEWRLDVGRATFSECQIRLIPLLSWVRFVKKNSGAQAWKCAAQTLYFSAHTEKNYREHCTWSNLAHCVLIFLKLPGPSTDHAPNRPTARTKLFHLGVSVPGGGAQLMRLVWSVENTGQDMPQTHWSRAHWWNLHLVQGC